mgnify:CR=1 FL=1
MATFLQKFQNNPRKKIDRLVFTILPEDREELFKSKIQPTIEAIEYRNSPMDCHSYLDNRGPGNLLDFIIEKIQQANIVVADITGFNASVMFELGLVMSRKENVIIICENATGAKNELPFNIKHEKVHFYDLENPSGPETTIEEILKEQVQFHLTESLSGPRFNSQEAQKLMKDAIDLRKSGKGELALYAFKDMVKLEKGNWYIYYEWGITLRIIKDYKEAEKQLNLALQQPSTSNKDKAQVYIELARVNQEGNNLEEAGACFDKAETLDSNNADLYEAWADYHDSLGEYGKAMEKIKHAYTIKQTRLLKIKLAYYVEKFSEENFKMTFAQFLRLQDSQQTNFNNRRNRHEQGPIRPNGNWENWAKSHMPERNKPFLTEGKIIRNQPNGVLVALDEHVTGLIPAKKLPGNFGHMDRFAPGKQVKVAIYWIDKNKRHVFLSLQPE